MYLKVIQAELGWLVVLAREQYSRTLPPEYGKVIFATKYEKHLFDALKSKLHPLHIFLCKVPQNVISVEFSTSANQHFS